MASYTTLGIKDFSTLIGVSTHLIYKIIKEQNLNVVAQGNRKTLPPATVKTIMEQRGFNYSGLKGQGPFIINVFGMKGGIGKTAIATAIAEGASRLGFRVLAVDLDMQGNLTQSFSMKKHGQKVLKDIVKGDAKIEDVILNVHQFLDLLPSSLENSQIETILSSQTLNYTGYFKNLFKPVLPNYDLIITDCPPSINKITACATCFSDYNLIPVNADMDSFDGITMSVSEIKRLENTFSDQGLNISYHIVFNKYDAREKLSLSIMKEIAKQDALASSLLPVVIRTDTTFKNTKAIGEYIFDAKKSSAKEDCFSLIAEITGITHWIKEKAIGKKQKEFITA